MPETDFGDFLFLAKKDAKLNALVGIHTPELENEVANSHFSISIDCSFQTEAEDVFR